MERGIALSIDQNPYDRATTPAQNIVVSEALDIKLEDGKYSWCRHACE